MTAAVALLLNKMVKEEQIQPDLNTNHFITPAFSQAVIYLVLLTPSATKFSPQIYAVSFSIICESVQLILYKDSIHKTMINIMFSPIGHRPFVPV